MTTKTKTRSKAAAKPPSRRKVEDQAQYERFRQFAREHGADAAVEQFDRGFRKIVPPKQP